MTAWLMFENDFNATFYATLAQVIPVFALLMLAAEHWRNRPAVRGMPLGLLNLSCLGFAVSGEIVAITALQREEAPGGAGELLVLGALILPIVRVCLPYLVEAYSEVRDGLPSGWRPWLPRIATISAFAMWVLYEVDEAIALGVLAVLLFLLYAASSLLSIGTMKSDAVEDRRDIGSNSTDTTAALTVNEVANKPMPNHPGVTSRRSPPVADELKEIGSELDRIEEGAMHSSQNQFEQAKIWATVRIWVSLPATFLAAVLAVGTGGSLLADLVSKELSGALVLISAGLGAVVVWLRASDRAEECSASANEYLAIQNAARIARTVDLPREHFPEARENLTDLSERRDSVNRQAPVPSKLARKRARRNIEDGGQSYQTDGNPPAAASPASDEGLVSD